MPESVKVLTETTTFECGCVVHWRVEQGAKTPLTCPVHGSIWTRTDSEPVVPQAELDRLRAVGERQAEALENMLAAFIGEDPRGGLEFLSPRLARYPEHAKTTAQEHAMEALDSYRALKSYREAVPEHRCAECGQSERQHHDVYGTNTHAFRAVPEREEPHGGE